MRLPRVITVVALVLVVACLAGAPASAVAKSSPKLSVPASYLVTTSGHVLWKHNSAKERRVASTIKMLNALVLIERANLNDDVKVAAKAAGTPDGVGLVKGQHLTVRKLLECMLVASANDAAEALAIHIGGSEKAYVKLMNAKAKELGLTQTHAIDPHGLSKREHSTAHDLSVLARHVMADPVLRKIVKMRSVSVPSRAGKSVRVASTDHLLGHYAGIEGVKTGFTNPAGYCFVGAAKRNGVELFSVVLGSSSLGGRFSQSRKLLDWGFAGFKLKTLVSTADTAGVVGIEGGMESSVTVHPSVTATAVVWTRTPRTSTIVMPASVLAPVHKGEQLGVVKISQDATTLVSVPLLADNDVAAEPTVTVVPTPVVNAQVKRPTVWARLGHLPATVWTAVLAGLHLTPSSGQLVP